MNTMRKKLTSLISKLIFHRMDNADLMLLENWKQDAVDNVQFADSLKQTESDPDFGPEQEVQQNNGKVLLMDVPKPAG